jgi:tripartite-type tricarboxylate transporter receptor subunit TctC
VSDAVLAAIRGDAQIACMPAASVVSQAKADKVKMFAVSTVKRSPYLPEVPTLKESGIDVEADAWMGLIAPGAGHQGGERQGELVLRHSGLGAFSRVPEW